MENNTESASPEDEYKFEIDAEIRNVLDELQCQPILFIGSGISRRYSDIPDWMTLLELISNTIGIDEKQFSYLRQKFAQDPISIGTHLTELVFEWAWDKGKNQFAVDLFDGSHPKDIFVKTLASNIIYEKSKSFDDVNKGEFRLEVEKLKRIKPHAIITTNYDDLLSTLFDDYETVVGQKILKTNLNYFGEIFKIHGCISDPTSLILNQHDYNDYRKKRPYLAAKLLTYLSEHPVFIFGYGLSDPNVVELLDDVGEVLGTDDQLIENLFYVNWKSIIDDYKKIPREHLIAGSSGNYRVRAIETTDFGWIFDALAQERELSGLNTRVLRALLARTYQLIRTDIPRKKVEVNYETLEHAVFGEDKLSAVLGISRADGPNMMHPYVLTQVGQRLGFDSWHGAHALLLRIFEETGEDIKASDNKYHCQIKTGAKSKTRKYSDAAVELLVQVRDNQNYEVSL